VKQLKKIILASLTFEDICTIFLSETTHPTTHHHIPEDLNTNKTAVRTSNIKIRGNYNQKQVEYINTLHKNTQILVVYLALQTMTTRL
jgi:hypothetical protein